jgi:predicted acetyltransferase
MAVEIRPATEAEAGEFRSVLSRNFGYDADPDGQEGFLRIWEPDRSICAFENGALIATSGAFSLQLSVPGAVLPTGGTTMVSVAPTHRRRGLLRRMMEAHLRDVSEHGEQLAALWASESSIYGRFGYGVAAQEADLTIPTDGSGFHRLAPEPAPVRFLTSEEARSRIPPLYESVRRSWPGFYQREEAWWNERWFKDRPRGRDGASSLRFGMTADSDGYVIYRQKPHWEAGTADGELVVRDLVGTSPESWAGLWAFVLNHDLTATVKAPLRSPSDPIQHLLAAPRRMRQRRNDSIWIRAHDPAAALASRAFQTPGRLVLEVADPFLARTVTLELEAGPDGASCSPIDRPADLTLDIEDLGACYLGWARFVSLARAGRVRGNLAALTLADQMFNWETQPWCPEIF